MARGCVNVVRVNHRLQHVQKWVSAIFFPQSSQQWLHSMDEKDILRMKYAKKNIIHPDKSAVNSYCPIVHPKKETLSLFFQLDVIFNFFLQNSKLISVESFWFYFCGKDLHSKIKRSWVNDNTYSRENDTIFMYGWTLPLKYD